MSLEELDGLEEKALNTGASKCFIGDLREEFARDYIYPMFQANAIYEGYYLLGTSLARPVIGKGLVEAAERFGAAVLFADIHDFTRLSSRMSAEEVVSLLEGQENEAFAARYAAELGDAYFALGRYDEARASYQAALGETQPTVNQGLIQLKLMDIPENGGEALQEEEAAAVSEEDGDE